MFKKRKSIFIITTLAIVAIIGWTLFGGGGDPEYDIETAEYRDVIEVVAIVGTVIPSKSVDLAFEKGGRVVNVYSNVGDRVNVGDRLISLDASEASASLAQAEAAIETARAGLTQLEAALVRDQAVLAELRLGTRPEEIALEEIKVANAEAAMEDSISNIKDKLKDAYTRSDNAIRNNADQLFDDPRSSSPRLKSTISASNQVIVGLEWSRLTLETVLSGWNSSLSQINVVDTSMALEPYISETEGNLQIVSDFLDGLSAVANSQSSGASLTQATIDSWKADISSGRTSVNTAKANTITAKEGLQSSESALSLARQQLELKLAGVVIEQIEAQEAKVQEGEANITSQIAKIKESRALADQRRVALRQMTLWSPISGVVAYRMIEEGEIVAASERVVSVISENMFEIEADVSEADVGKVAVGNSADVVLDAYGPDSPFRASMVSIDPAETIINGVATYTAKLVFEGSDSRIRSGMSASVRVEANRRDNVLTVPLRAIMRRDGAWVVKKVQGETIDEVVVETGVRGSSGYVEIISGIGEGDMVVVGNVSDL